MKTAKSPIAIRILFLLIWDQPASLKELGFKYIPPFIKGNLFLGKSRLISRNYDFQFHLRLVADLKSAPGAGRTGLFRKIGIIPPRLPPEKRAAYR
jgi:hypothetical protein